MRSGDEDDGDIPARNPDDEQDACPVTNPHEFPDIDDPEAAAEPEQAEPARARADDGRRSERNGHEEEISPERETWVGRRSL